MTIVMPCESPGTTHLTNDVSGHCGAYLGGGVLGVSGKTTTVCGLDTEDYLIRFGTPYELTCPVCQSKEQ